MTDWLERIKEWNFFSSKDEERLFLKWEKHRNFSKLEEGSRDNLMDLVVMHMWRCDDLEEDLDHANYRARIAGVHMRKAFSERRKADAARQALQKELDNIRVGVATKKNLEIGGKASAIKRSTIAKELQIFLNKAVYDLFLHGEGWKMSNKKMATFLFKNGFDKNFTHGTLIRKIAPIAASIRKTVKE